MHDVPAEVVGEDVKAVCIVTTRGGTAGGNERLATFSCPPGLTSASEVVDAISADAIVETGAAGTLINVVLRTCYYWKIIKVQYLKLLLFMSRKILHTSKCFSLLMNFVIFYCRKI